MIMTKPNSAVISRETGEILQRLFDLRNRFKVGMPENLVLLRKRLAKSNLGDKGGGIVDIDLFHKLAQVLSSAQEPVSMGEVSRALEVPLSTATRLMDWLVKNDYAQRLPDPEDRRIVRMALTDEGRSLYQTINGYMLERLERVMSRFTPGERDSILTLLRKLYTILQEEAEATSRT
jgi:DNA-binding MarR family transcriptional regulator